MLHQYACPAAALGGGSLVTVAQPGATLLASAIYGVALTFLFGASALYHRPTWGGRARLWLRRLDHSMIFLFIAASYTPFALLRLPAQDGRVLLAVMWVMAVVGILKTLFWVSAPKAVSAAVYVAMGWVALAYLPQLWHALRGGQMALLVAGGVLYTAGAVGYSMKRPNPRPGVFGYHEVFHATVILAAACHYASVLWVVLSDVT
jgi:hemolysin III